MSVNRNVIANYLGQGWAAVMGIAFVPLYISTLGAETYGLIGVFAVLQAWVALLDLGLTPTLNREMAQLRAGTRTSESIRDLLRTLEVVYALASILMIAAIWLAAGSLAAGWLKADRIAPEQLAFSIRIMSFVLAARWVEQVYRGALQGLQDQVWLNAMQGFVATLRWGGAYLVIAFGWPTIVAFFIWQGSVSLLTTALLVHRTYCQLPAVQRAPKFSLSALYDIRRFASGMFLGAILGVVLTQADKIIVSKLLPLDQFGYYALASTLAGGLLQLITPMNNALYPRLTEQLARGNMAELTLTYSKACQWLAAIVVPPALLLGMFPSQVLLAWTGNPILAHSTAALLTPLALGTLMNGLMNLPYMLQLAHGWTSLAVKINLVAVMLVLPSLAWFVQRDGAEGAAWVWFALNAGYVLVTAQLMHRRILPELKWPWYRTAVARPLLAGLVACIVLRQILPQPSSRPMTTVFLAFAGVLVALVVMLALRDVRQRLVATCSVLLPPRLR